MIRKLWILSTFAFLIALIGCSSQENSPVINSLKDIENRPELTVPNLWGVWDININPLTGEVEQVPVRGAEFTINTNKFLQPPTALQNLLSIQLDPLTSFPTGYVVLNVNVQHPFPGLAKFSGFDVRGIVMGDGSIQGIAESSILFGGAEGIEILNSDGMTRWFNASEFTSYETIFGFTKGKMGFNTTNFSATVNDYKYFCDGLDPEGDLLAFFDDPTCPNPRGLSSVTSTNTRRYELQFPLPGGTPSYKFQYAIIASWHTPTVNPPVNIPDDFPVEANCAEPYLVHVLDQSDMYYEDELNKGGTLRLLVRVFDHQGAESPNGVSDEISAIRIETQNGLIDSGDLAEFEGAGLTAAYLSCDNISATWLLEVSNVNPSGQGEFPVFLTIESADVSGYDPGFPGFIFPGAPLAIYLRSLVSVGPGVQSESPVAVAEIVNPLNPCVGDPVEFDASGSYDPDGGSIVSYEWDFDGDGTYGDAYDSGTDINPTITFSEQGTQEVDLLVTDDEAETDTLDTPLNVTVGGITWVDNDADPGLADGSFEHPWPTIGEGILNVDTACGDGWIKVMEGEYGEKVTMVPDILLEGVGDPAPLISSDDASAIPLVNMTSADNATITHFRLQPANSVSGVYIDFAADVTVDDIEFVDVPDGNSCSYGVYASSWSTSGVVINDVRVDGYHKNMDGFIYAGGEGVQVTNNVLLNITYMSACSMSPIIVSDAGSTGLVAKNVVGHITFSEAFDDIDWVHGVEIDGSPGLTVRNNLVFDVDNILAEGWTWGIGADYASGMVFEHNTVTTVNGPLWIYGFDVTHYNQDPVGVIHRSNIVSNLYTQGAMNWRWGYLGYWDDAVPGLPVDYSCAFNVGNPFRDQVIQGVGFVNTDPMFMDPGNDDFRVSAGSNCSGTAHDGTDMGAYGGTDPLTWLPD